MRTTWLPIQTAPSGQVCFVACVKGKQGPCTLAALFVAERSIETTHLAHECWDKKPCECFDTRWLESEGRIFMPSGWYSIIWSVNAGKVDLHERIDPSFWTPVPEYPSEQAPEVTA